MHSNILMFIREHEVVEEVYPRELNDIKDPFIFECELVPYNEKLKRLVESYMTPIMESEGFDYFQIGGRYKDRLRVIGNSAATVTRAGLCLGYNYPFDLNTEFNRVVDVIEYYGLKDIRSHEDIPNDLLDKFVAVDASTVVSLMVYIRDCIGINVRKRRVAFMNALGRTVQYAVVDGKLVIVDKVADYFIDSAIKSNNDLILSLDVHG